MNYNTIPPRHVSLYPSATLGTGETDNGDAVETKGRIGGVFFLDITANTGAFTLDVKLQEYDRTAGKWIDIPGAAFAQQSSSPAHVALQVYPGVAGTGRVRGVLPQTIRAQATTAGAGTDVTFSVQADLIP